MSRIHLSKADVTEVEELYILCNVRSAGVSHPYIPDTNALEAEITAARDFAGCADFVRR